jgi:hypothetical protein
MPTIAQAIRAYTSIHLTLDGGGASAL